MTLNCGLPTAADMCSKVSPLSGMEKGLSRMSCCDLKAFTTSRYTGTIMMTNSTPSSTHRPGERGSPRSVPGAFPPLVSAACGLSRTFASSTTTNGS